MFQICNPSDGEWTQFYLVDVNTDEIYECDMEELPDEVMGKYIGGIVGYTPVWYYITVKKTKLRNTEK